MKGLLALLLMTFLLFGCPKPAAAHQPRIVSGEVVDIKNPQVSQAFYASLQGSPDTYRIAEEEEFNLYVSLLVPDLPGIRKDYLVEVFRIDDGRLLEQLFEMESKGHGWEPFYEPFAGDRYHQGPESQRVLPAGVYELRVSNPDNEGKYVLSVGREERFTLSEAVNTIRRLPAVKRYFGKSPLTAYFNLVGVFMLISLVLVAGVVFGAYRFLMQVRNR